MGIDDGKRNVVGPAFVEAMNNCLDRAEPDKAKVVVLEGRAGTFSAGFDLKEFQKGPEAAFSLVCSGFEMLLRLFEFPGRLLPSVRAMVLAWVRYC